MLSSFEPYPFEKLRILFGSVEQNKNLNQIAFTIGEPQFETPKFIQEELAATTSFLNKYPKSAGEDILKQAIQQFLEANFSLKLKSCEIIPTLGTREVLFNFPQFLMHNEENATIAYPNPFYQIYEGAALACKAKSVLLELNENNSFKPDINQLEDRIKKDNIKLVILNSPNNPTSSTMSINELSEYVKLALKYNFILLNDECYNQIYFECKPASLLEASYLVGNTDFKNILVVNSISKRSSAPGLRSGFIAGDAQLLDKYGLYRTYVGAANGLPMQYAAAKAWADEKHVIEARDRYRKNFEIANKLLGTKTPEATFYLWLKVKNGEEFAKRAYAQESVSVLPGQYLARNFATEYVRIALVESEEKTIEGLTRLAKLL